MCLSRGPVRARHSSHVGNGLLIIWWCNACGEGLFLCVLWLQELGTETGFCIRKEHSTASIALHLGCWTRLLLVLDGENVFSCWGFCNNPYPPIQTVASLVIKTFICMHFQYFLNKLELNFCFISFWLLFLSPTPLCLPLEYLQYGMYMYICWPQLPLHQIVTNKLELHVLVCAYFLNFIYISSWFAETGTFITISLRLPI